MLSSSTSPTIVILLCASSVTGGPWFKGFDLPTPPKRGLFDADRARASALLRKGRSLKECEAAVSLLEKSLCSDPDDPMLCLECAKALNAVMRIRTNSNTLHITRMLDTPDNKKVWKKHGKRAVELAFKAKQARPADPEALVAYADAYFFANSVKGVLAAATTGSGLKFKGNSKELISKCPSADGGIGHACAFFFGVLNLASTPQSHESFRSRHCLPSRRYLGAFFLMAPWPLANAKKAEQHLSAAYKIARSRRNSYYLGVMHYRLGDPAAAIPFFTEAVKAAPASASEADFGDWVKAEAQKAVGECQRLLE